MKSAIAALALTVLWSTGGMASTAVEACRWPAWERFADHYLSTDGRVIDPGSARQVTVSEGQAYAAFFALVGNDREAFDRILRWTEDNLSAGDFSQRLPAWRWGRRDDGSWGVLDANPAADADVWLAYVLAEAAEAWSSRRYRVLAHILATGIFRDEVRRVEGLGATLIPAPQGFALDGGGWRLNPSYLPLQLLEGLALHQPEQAWAGLIPSSRRLLQASAPAGFAPDWVHYRPDSGFAPDPQTDAVGSYDAIRVYLWLGMRHAQAEGQQALLQHFRPMAEATETLGAPPERVDSRNGETRNHGNWGFSAAVVPFLKALGRDAEHARQAGRARAAEERGETYYSSALALFGLGWDEGRYAFRRDGRLRLRWQEAGCRS